MRTLISSVILTCALTLGAGAAAAQPADARAPKVLRYAFEVAETGFDPAQLSDLYSRIIARSLFEAPLRYAYLAKPGTLEPATATGLPEVSADFRTYTFHIKPGIYFIDDVAFKGKKRELVAADYVYSFKRLADPRWKSPSWGGIESADIKSLMALRAEALKTGKFDYDREIEGIKTLDRYTFRITLGRPDPRFATSLADASIMGAVAREVVEYYGDKIMEHPVGTGPFKLGAWRRSSQIVLDRNPSYREDIYSAEGDPSDPAAVALAQQLKGKRLPMLDRVEISIIEESQPRWLSFLNGEYDYIERMPLDLTPIAIPNNQPSPALAKKGIQIERTPVIDVTFAVYNMEDPVIGGYTPDKVALRRAINLALQTDEIIRSIYKFQAFPAQSIVMPRTYGYDPNFRTEMGETDAARANAMLDTYGYKDVDGDGYRELPDGSPLELEFSTQPDQRSRINDEIWKKSMDSIGIKLRYRVAKWPEQLRFARNGQFMIWSLGLSASGPDSGPGFREAYGPAAGAENLSRFRWKAYDELFLRAEALPDGPERLAIMREMQKILTAHAPMQFISHRYAVDMAYPWVKGYRRWPFVLDWWRYVDIDLDEMARRTR